MSALVSISEATAEDLIVRVLFDVSVAVLVVVPLCTLACVLIVGGARRKFAEPPKPRRAPTRPRNPEVTPAMANEPSVDGKMTLLCGSDTAKLRVNGTPPRGFHLPVPVGEVLHGKTPDPTETATFVVGDLDPALTGEHAPGDGRVPVAEYVRVADVHALTPVGEVVGDGVA